MKRVNPKLYSTDYFLNICRGFGHFSKTRGISLERSMKKVADEIPSVKNKIVLDLGSGRGEYSYWAAENGAKLVIGIDYSTEAINLANKVKKRWPKKIREKIKFQLMDAKDLRFKEKMFDMVISTEVFEHLYEEEQAVVLKNVKNVLKDNGELYIYTAPSKTFTNITYKYWSYPLSSILVWINNVFTKSRYPNIVKNSDLRTRYHEEVHVNEPTYFQLLGLFKKVGFYGNILSLNVAYTKTELGWKDKLFNFIVFLIPISRFPPLNILFGTDYYCVLKKAN